jgi:stalled ribosome rescue protein Dom34
MKAANTTIEGKYVAIWIDHETAKVFHLDRPEAAPVELHAHKTNHHTHGGAHLKEGEFFTQLADQLRDAEGILIMGPGTAKHQFLHYLEERRPKMAQRVTGCEAVDHPTDGQARAWALATFERQLAAANG